MSKLSDFTGFTFNGKHSASLGIVRVSEGKRYQDILIPDSEDYTTNIPTLAGDLYFDSKPKSIKKDFSLVFDGICESQLREIREWLDCEGLSELILDESPYKAWWAKVQGQPKFDFVCFTTPSNWRNYMYTGTNVEADFSEVYEINRNIEIEENGVVIIFYQCNKDNIFVKKSDCSINDVQTQITIPKSALIYKVYPDERIYKGEISVSFYCPEPYAHSPRLNSNHSITDIWTLLHSTVQPEVNKHNIAADWTSGFTAPWIEEYTQGWKVASNLIEKRSGDGTAATQFSTLTTTISGTEVTYNMARVDNMGDFPIGFVLRLQFPKCLNLAMSEQAVTTGKSIRTVVFSLQHGDTIEYNIINKQLVPNHSFSLTFHQDPVAGSSEEFFNNNAKFLEIDTINQTISGIYMKDGIETKIPAYFLLSTGELFTIPCSKKDNYYGNGPLDDMILLIQDGNNYNLSDIFEDHPYRSVSGASGNLEVTTYLNEEDLVSDLYEQTLTTTSYYVATYSNDKISNINWFYDTITDCKIYKGRIPLLGGFYPNPDPEILEPTAITTITGALNDVYWVYVLPNSPSGDMFLRATETSSTVLADWERYYPPEEWLASTNKTINDVIEGPNWRSDTTSQYIDYNYKFR